MSVQERMIRYCKIDTQSCDDSATVPTTSKQFDLARLLEKEMVAMGMENVQLTDQCYLYGEVPATVSYKTPVVGFIAHLDTAPDFTGANVSPRIVENYDGKDIPLNELRMLKQEEFPALKLLTGHDLIVTDGNTLLGADDKAGIAEILEACQWLLSHRQIPHGIIKVAFTPDEEVGRGADYFDVEGFGCDFAYTMDGGEVCGIADETFNAAAAIVRVEGVSVHPGSAKDKMIHAANVAMEYHALLPKAARAETTEGRQGFNHLTDIKGDVAQAELHYILRNHDQQKLEKQKEILELAKRIINQRYKRELISVEIKDSYKNMNEILKDQPLAVNLAKKVLTSLGITPVMESVRGGTDGSRLTFMGLPCPNLGTGGGNYHGPYEYCSVQEMEIAVKVILGIVQEIAKEAKE